MRWVIVAFLAVLMIGIVMITFTQFRRGGYGPRIATTAWTQAGRDRTNRSYAKHGWAKPYDEEGNLLPKDQRTLPDDAKD